MKKRVHKHSKSVARHVRPRKNLLVWVRGWMFVVVFAMMLGLGAIVGRFLSEKLNETTPQVAGVQTEAK
ncbi:MAG: hypothetical protein AAB457_01715 [Patescibacteria group bacterium]